MLSSMDKYSFHDGAFIKARILKENWIRLFKDKQKCFFFSFSFPNKLISFKKRVKWINNDHSAPVEVFWVISSSKPVRPGCKT